MLQSQRQLAVTGLESAKANLVTSQSGLEVAQAALQAAETGLQIAQSNSEAELLVAQQSLDNLDENATGCADGGPTCGGSGEPGGAGCHLPTRQYHCTKQPSRK